MNTIRKIELSEDQAAWLEKEVSAGNIANENNFIADLIAEAKLRATQPEAQIKKIREMLEEAENGGISNRDPDDIWNELLETKY